MHSCGDTALLQTAGVGPILGQLDVFLPPVPSWERRAHVSCCHDRIGCHLAQPLEPRLGIFVPGLHGGTVWVRLVRRPVEQLLLGLPRGVGLGMDVKVILTPPCIFCTEKDKKVADRLNMNRRSRPAARVLRVENR